VTPDHEWYFPRKKTEKNGANKAAQHHGKTTQRRKTQNNRKSKKVFQRKLKIVVASFHSREF